MSWMMYIVVVLLIAAFWYLGLGMGCERGERRQKAVADEYREKYWGAVDAYQRIADKQNNIADEYRTKYHWAVDRYDDLLNRYMQLKETLAKVVDGNE